MSTTTSTAFCSGRLSVPGAELHYELRGSGPLLALHAAPMDARSFEALADCLARDHTVLTSDPRGINRSTLEGDPDDDAEVTPEVRADDLARLLDHLGLGPAALFGSSGGAVSALALLQARPDLLSTVVAHEPPIIPLLPDRDELSRATREMIEVYRAGDRLGYWKLFLAMAGIELPPGAVEAWFGTTLSGQAARDERFAVERMDRATSFWEPDLARLRDLPAPPGRLWIGIGRDSAGQLCDRTSRALGHELGIDPVLFPGDHTGFVDHPQEFADHLRRLLG